MSDNAKDILFNDMIRLSNYYEHTKWTTIELSEKLRLGRSVVSLYLNQLFKEEKVTKFDGRPVKWKVKEQFLYDERYLVRADPFEEFIGYNNSQHKIIEQCKSALAYPPNGLNILLRGPTGVGKSLFAFLAYQYLLEEKLIRDKAPFVVLNCADYANNQELLSSALFGHRSGAFTGAENDKNGLVDAADNGVLFLDEVHRLSHENQEKLFRLIDTGMFRRLGESSEEKAVNIRFIFATTEKPEEYLLQTFLRRIPVLLEIENFESRPINEKLDLLYHIFSEEASILNKDIVVKPEVLQAFCEASFTGNVGEIKNLIKVTCSKIYRKQRKSAKVVIEIKDLDIKFSNVNRIIDSTFTSMLVPSNSMISDNKRGTIQESEDLWNDFFAQIHQDCQQNKLLALSTYLDDKLKMSVEKEDLRLSYFNNYFTLKLQQNIRQVFGISFDEKSKKIIANFLHKGFNFSEISKEIIRFFSHRKYISFKLATLCYEQLATKYIQNREDILVLLTVLIASQVDEGKKINGLIIAHGESTATSIQQAANQLCKAPIFDAINMPIDISFQQTIKEIQNYLKLIDTTNGLLLLVDMGSLIQLYSSIRESIIGDLVIINNVTTAVALDTGIKIQNNDSLTDIIHQSENYEFHVQYYEGLTELPNIIISCMSGLGVSKVLVNIFKRYLSKKIEVIAVDFRQLCSMFGEVNEKHFSKTRCILTTVDAIESSPVTCLNIYDLFNDDKSKIFYQNLSIWLSQDEFDRLIIELKSFFSLEGIKQKLLFLNPEVILRQVEKIILRYEELKGKKFSFQIELNFYLHIALLIERLISTKNDEAEQVEFGRNKDEEDFRRVTKEIFESVEYMYNIEINNYEISLLYYLLEFSN